MGGKRGRASGRGGSCSKVLRGDRRPWVKALGVATFNLYSFFVTEALEVQNY